MCLLVLLVVLHSKQERVVHQLMLTEERCVPLQGLYDVLPVYLAELLELARMCVRLKKYLPTYGRA